MASHNRQRAVGLLITIALSFTLIACGRKTDEAETAPVVVPAQLEHETHSAQAFYKTISFSLGSSSRYAFSSVNNDLLITSDESGVFNAYRLDTLSGDRIALSTSVDSPVYAVSWFPEDDRLLFTQDGGGDELTHVYVQSAEGAVTDLTPGDNVKAGVIGWSHDASSFFLYTNERDAAAFDVYSYDTTDYSRNRIYTNTEGLDIGSVSGNGRWVVMVRNNSNADSDLFLADLTADQSTAINITPHEGNITYRSYTFTADSNQLIYATNEYGEFNQAWTYDVNSGQHSKLISADWDVSYVSYSPSGRYRVSGTNVDASTLVSVVDRVTGESIDLSHLPLGDVRQVRFNRDESAIAFGLNSDTAPYDVYLMSLDGAPRQLTQATNPDIDSRHLVDGEVVRFESYDGLQIPGILYRPKTATAEQPVPAMVSVHGGPGGQSRKGYSASIQHLVNHGYAVFRINNRGSSGYGKTFFHLDDQSHGEADLGDVVASKEFLSSMPWIDGERIGIMGGSYGGYMVAAALAFEPDVFDVGINIFGVTNWVRTLKAIPAWWGSFRRSLYVELGDPNTDEERLRRISPLFHAQQISKPLLVVQGANDPRVLQVESDELVAAVRANDVPVEYLLFDDEGHGFRKRDNRIEASEAYLTFLQTYL